ncbi:MAG: hypothetical protein M1819_000863 [Sarea resinae]|nr:MAG: hypothetical protein M1819_000863 [Sarea resinae]
MLLPRLVSLLWLLASVVAVRADDRNAEDIKTVRDSCERIVWYRYIRLTSDRPSQQGWLFSWVPLTATNWEVEIEFKIHGEGNLFGDGMAIWLTKQRSSPGTVFGSTDRFEGLGIFIDTYKNNRPGIVFPYVMAMLGDGQTTYDQAHDGKTNELAGCSARGLRGASVPTKMRITYFQDQNLVVDLQYKAEGEWTNCFDVPNVSIPSVAYLGFSAETGELSDNHDIIRVDSKNLFTKTRFDAGRGRPGDPKNPKGKSKGYDASRRKGGWVWFFFKLVLFFGACVGGYGGYLKYKQSKRSSRF